MTFASGDRKILRRLQLDGRTSNVALAEEIGMAPSPCLRRVRSLEEAAVIKAYKALLDRRKLGIGLMAFVEVKVPQVAGRDITADFRRAVEDEPWILDCYITAGQFDFLMRVVAKDMQHYSELAQLRLLHLPGVKDMRTTFVLDTFKEDAPLPIP